MLSFFCVLCPALRLRCQYAACVAKLYSTENIKSSKITQMCYTSPGINNTTHGCSFPKKENFVTILHRAHTAKMLFFKELVKVNMVLWYGYHALLNPSLLTHNIAHLNTCLSVEFVRRGFFKVFVNLIREMVQKESAGQVDKLDLFR